MIVSFDVGSILFNFKKIVITQRLSHQWIFLRFVHNYYFATERLLHFSLDDGKHENPHFNRIVVKMPLI